MSAFTTITIKISKTKAKRLTAGKKNGEEFQIIGWGSVGQIPQRKNCVWTLSKAIEKGILWIGARCAKRISKSVD